mmetsp:Transcript_14860/g.46823  ORF Transcript_14860/g.46823 Transcript_14860/m.46823 type:complete len:416 (-) Transcript_14860:52-1299(-)
MGSCTPQVQMPPLPQQQQQASPAVLHSGGTGVPPAVHAASSTALPLATGVPALPMRQTSAGTLATSCRPLSPRVPPPQRAPMPCAQFSVPGNRELSLGGPTKSSSSSSCACVLQQQPWPQSHNSPLSTAADVSATAARPGRQVQAQPNVQPPQQGPAVPTTVAEAGAMSAQVPPPGSGQLQDWPQAPQQQALQWQQKPQQQRQQHLCQAHQRKQLQQPQQPQQQPPPLRHLQQLQQAQQHLHVQRLTSAAAVSEGTGAPPLMSPRDYGSLQQRQQQQQQPPEQRWQPQLCRQQQQPCQPGAVKPPPTEGTLAQAAREAISPQMSPPVPPQSHGQAQASRPPPPVAPSPGAASPAVGPGRPPAGSSAGERQAVTTLGGRPCSSRSWWEEMAQARAERRSQHHNPCRDSFGSDMAAA